MNQNKLIFILLGILCIYILLKIYKYLLDATIKKIKHHFMLELDNYYVTNIYLTVTMLLLYFMSFFCIFFFYRLSRLGTEISIESFTKISNFIEVIYNLLLFFFVIRYYIKILTFIFYKYILQLHFYLLQHEIYNNILDFERNRYHWVSDVFEDIFCYFYDKTRTQEQFVETFSYENKDKDVFKSREYAHWSFVQKYKIIFYSYKILSQILHILSMWSSRFLYYAPYSMLFLVFLYDIHNGLLKYTFYILFALFVLTFIRKIRYFVQVKDPVYDDLIMKLFYKSNKPYADRKHSIYMESIVDKDLYNFSITHGKALSHYLSVDLHVNYVINPERTRNRNLLDNYAKRLNIIFVNILLMIYCLYSNKHLIVFFNLNLKLSTIIIILNIILYCINKRTIYPETKNHAKRTLANTRYIVLFYIIILFCLTLLYIILKNHLMTMPSEIIYILGDNIKLLEMFSFEEKQLYFRRYVKYLEEYYELDSASVTSLLYDMNDIIMDLNLDSLKEIIDDKVMALTNKVENNFTKEFWHKIYTWFTKNK